MSEEISTNARIVVFGPQYLQSQTFEVKLLNNTVTDTGKTSYPGFYFYL